jgi:hypothetical protein
MDCGVLMCVRVKSVNISSVVGVSSSSSSSSINGSLLSHNASTRFEVGTAVISKASDLQRCYALSCRHFESSGGSQCLMVLNPEHEITMFLRNVSNCRHNDTT